MMKKVFLIIFLFSSLSLRAQVKKEKTVEEYTADLEKIEKSIEVTKKKMKEVKDLNFVPDLYFVLAELYVDKSRFIYAKTREENKETPINELDFSESSKAKKQAIEIYQRFIENFPKSDLRDKAHFFIAHEYREMGNQEEMIKTYSRLIRDFPKSSFWEESNLILGDYFFDQKKDPKGALDFYQKILERHINPFMPLARYKAGWCYLNLNKFYDAMLSFEGIITLDSKIPMDGLPEFYKKSDVRRDALTSLVWPYSEQKNLSAERANALKYFERLSPDRPTLLKVLPKLTKRLLMKNKIEDAIPVYLRLIEISHDLEYRLDIIDSFYEALKKSKRDWPLEDLPEALSRTLIRVRYSTTLDKGEKNKHEKNYEIYLRDFATHLHKKAKSFNKEIAFQNAIKAYEYYIYSFPKNKYTPSMILNMAEVFFLSKNYTRAGYFYEQASLKTNSKNTKEAMDSSIQSFAFALKTPEKLSKLELAESREGFRDVGRNFVKNYPNDPANPMIYFNIARTYYDERDFNKSIQSFKDFINIYPNHKETTTAGQLILDAYNQREDYDGLIKSGKELIANTRINNSTFKKDISEIIKQAEFRKLQDQLGDSGNRDYAKKLLSFASKYQGTSLGDQALYEAFVSMKAKKDPGAYEPGEQLLLKHGDSRYAKEVVGSMGQMAMNSTDFRRAAKYFELFARKYPAEPTSRDLLKSAASLRELMGDFNEAATNYRDLGQSDMIAKQYIMAQNWMAAGQALTAKPLGGVKGNYWMGLALFRQKMFDQSRPYLNQSANGRSSSYEEKTMSAHSLYLISGIALKEYQAVQLGSGNEAQLIKTKMTMLNNFSQQMNRVIGFGNGKWTIAALYELGRANVEFAQFLNQASVPAGLNASQEAQYKQLISKQANDYTSKASGFFKTCLDSAEKFEVFTNFVKGCSSNGSQQVDEEKDERLSVKMTDNTPSEALQLRRRLLDSPRDVKMLMDLAQIFIGAQDYAMARLIYSRVLDIKKNDSTTEAWIGVCLMYMNDLESAGDMFKLALKHNSNEAVAIYGLAALYKHFDFKNKFQKMKSKLSSVSKPSGRLHEWMNSI